MTDIPDDDLRARLSRLDPAPAGLTSPAPAVVQIDPPQRSMRERELVHLGG